MHEHWRKYPPVHVSAALFSGIKTEASAGPAQPATVRVLTNAELTRDMPDPRLVQWHAIRAA